MYVSDGLTAKRISDLMQELESGQYKKEILPIAHAVMYSNQQLEDYQLLGAFHERT